MPSVHHSDFMPELCIVSLAPISQRFSFSPKTQLLETLLLFARQCILLQRISEHPVITQRNKIYSEAFTGFFLKNEPIQDFVDFNGYYEQIVTDWQFISEYTLLCGTLVAVTSGSNFHWNHHTGTTRKFQYTGTFWWFQCGGSNGSSNALDKKWLFKSKTCDVTWKLVTDIDWRLCESCIKVLAHAWVLTEKSRC